MKSIAWHVTGVVFGVAGSVCVTLRLYGIAYYLALSTLYFFGMAIMKSFKESE